MEIMLVLVCELFHDKIKQVSHIIYNILDSLDDESDRFAL